ncbi:unnamed protein product [Trypanosoma congolense IL3000]|uniref:WGS project CAEQ00000000 data, annotated contig 1575 n=1 Tax=Trypanosoma congolense (strain IL3000) TaxID=1068625 RepID=F9W767_TRYCI|nr:unnamed protein product [Trypanosoma congolense IL3000]
MDHVNSATTADAHFIGTSLADRLREAYRALVIHQPPQFLSPALRDLFEVTLNTEILLKPRGAGGLLKQRQERLQWYNEIYSGLRGVYNTSALLRYWVAGIVNYQLREVRRCVDAAQENTADGAVKDVQMFEAIQHALELRDVLQRLPVLVSFLFAWDVELSDVERFDSLLKEVIAVNFSMESVREVLLHLLAEYMRPQRRMQNDKVQGSAELTHHQRQCKPGDVLIALCELIQLFVGDRRTVEERVTVVILQGVVESCNEKFKQRTLLDLLQPDEASAKARREFVVDTWLRYWNSELELVRVIDFVDEAWVKGILLKLIFLWDPCDVSVGVEDDVRGAPVNLSCTYLHKLLHLTLEPVFGDIFGTQRLADAGVTTAEAGKQQAGLGLHGVNRIGVEEDLLEFLLQVANAMACAEAPPWRDIRCWESVGVVPSLPPGVARDVGPQVLADVCRMLLQEQLPRAVSSFLCGSEPDERQRWRLLQFLICVEKMFDRLCSVRGLNVRLLDARSSTGGVGHGGRGCFYSIVETALLRGEHGQREVNIFVDELLNVIHGFLLDKERAVLATAKSGRNHETVLNNHEDLRSAIRMAYHLSPRGALIPLYKRLLAYRLLSLNYLRQHDTAVAQLNRERLKQEESVCLYLLELIPGDRDAIQQMMQMCYDTDTSANMQEVFDQRQGRDAAGSSVKFAVKVLSRHAWPAYPVLTTAPSSLKGAMSNFSAAYEELHPSRRIVWLRTAFECVTFNVAYPRGKKTITGSLDLFMAFEYLSEVSAALDGNGGGASWDDVGRRVGKHYTDLQQELRKLLSDGFIAIIPAPTGAAGTEKTDLTSSEPPRWICLNPEFASHQTHFTFLAKQQRRHLRPATRSKQEAGVSDETHGSRVTATQAAIVSHMKALKCCCYDELFRLTQQSVQRHFQLQTSDFKPILEHLIEKGLIERDETKKGQFIYIA